MSVGLEGMRGHRVIVEANVRDEKEACIIIGLPDASMKESKERILSCLHTLGTDISMKKLPYIFLLLIKGKQVPGMIVPCLWQC